MLLISHNGGGIVHAVVLVDENGGLEILGGVGGLINGGIFWEEEGVKEERRLK